MVSDEDRAVCVAPGCSSPLGGRNCWRFDQAVGDWVRVEEPRVRGRERLTEEQVDQVMRPALAL